MKRLNLSDRIGFVGETRNAICARDGVLVYSSERELGLEGPDRPVRVWRSPATTANLLKSLSGIPITLGHVEVTDDPPAGAVGRVFDPEMKDLELPGELATMGVAASVSFADEGLVKKGDELSLGYMARLEPCEKHGCEFEQFDLAPHHLAVVPRGRCGPSCAIIDHETEQDENMKLHDAFLDGEKQPSPEQIVAIAMALPEAAKMLPADKQMEIAPSLKEIVDAVLPGELTKPEAIADNAGSEPEKQESAPKSESTPRPEQSLADHFSFVDRALELGYDGGFKGKSQDDVIRAVVSSQYDLAESADPAELSVLFKHMKKATADPAPAPAPASDELTKFGAGGQTHELRLVDKEY